MANWRFEIYPYFETYLKADIDGVPCVGHIDNTHQKFHKFREFKTGKIPWTQERADHHGQLAFYALLLQEKKGVYPEEVYLDWIETRADEFKNIHPTGEIQTFRVEITPEHIADITQRIRKAYIGICKLWNDWQASKEPDREKYESLNVFEQYRDIERKIRILEDQKTELKPTIEEELKNQDREKYEFLDEEGGTFYFTTRKKYILPEHITRKEKEYKQLKKEYEEQHEPDDITQSLNFKM